MSKESDFLDKLAESIADGASIDWGEIEKLPLDHEVRRLAELYRLIAGVGEVHRSADAEETPQPVDAGPIVGPSAPSGQALAKWGHLVLLRKIGEGAFGEVYHAHDTWLDHPVALKLFKPKGSNKTAATRILHEARKLARVRHPNVVSVHGADSHNGQVGFWMDLVEGDTLADLIQRGRLSAGEATYIGQELCRALAAVHQCEIVHRDVKAQNVMRAADGGRIMLMDFGAGEFVSDKPTMRAQGTPLYLAPEILDGGAASVRTDIYAAGVLLYHLVTGSFPVRGGSVGDLIAAHQRGERRPLLDIRPDLPNSYVTIVEQAIDPDPRRRFQSAGQMQAALTSGLIPDVRPIDVAAVPEAEKRPTSLQRIEKFALVATTAFIVTEFLGFVATRIFETALGVDSDFGAGVREYFDVGVHAVVPFLIAWAFFLLLATMLNGLWPLLRIPLAPIQRKASAATATLDSETIATLVVVTGIACLGIIVWWCSAIMYAVDVLRTGSPTESDLAPLGKAGLHLRNQQAFSSAALSFVLGLIVWRWFPILEHHARDASRVRILKWGALTLALFVVLVATLPRRFLWERFELVSFNHQPAFVIGRNTDEVLLYSPHVPKSKPWRVRKDSRMLERTGATGFIFDPQ